MKKLKPFTAIRVKDHSSPGAYSWVVFDSGKSNALGEFTYLADCVNAAVARRIVRALNGEQVRRRRQRRTGSRPRVGG